MAKKNVKNKKPGQPTAYKPEYCQKLIAFFDKKPWLLVNGKRQYQRMPSVNGFSKSINVCTSTIYNWRTKDHDSFHNEFLVAWNKAQSLRKDWLIDVGLSGLAPANSFKFVAVNCTDMRDKQETEHGVSDALSELLEQIGSNGKGLTISNPGS